MYSNSYFPLACLLSMAGLGANNLFRFITGDVSAPRDMADKRLLAIGAPTLLQ